MVDMVVKTEGPISVAYFAQTSGTVTYNLTDHVDGRRYRLLQLSRKGVSEGTTTRFLIRDEGAGAIHGQWFMTANNNEDYLFDARLGYEREAEFEVVIIGRFTGNLYFEKLD